MPFTIITGGSFTQGATAAGVKIPLPSSADMFQTWNMTKSAASSTGAIGGIWFGPKFGSGATPANDGLRFRKSASNSVLEDVFSNSSGTTAGNGFTYVTVVPQIEPQAPNAITGITAASPAVVTQTNTYSEGDIIQVYGTTGMLQIAGMNFQISSVSGSGYTLTGLRAAGFAAAATAGFTRRISKMLAVDPQFLYVTEICAPPW